MALEQYLAVVKKWWWLMVASMLVAAVSSYLAVSRVPRVYQATTTVMVGQSLREANPTYQDIAISSQLAQTYVNMVWRQPILKGAAEALGLPYVPWAGNVSARIVPGTQLLEISVCDTNPERARALADEIAHQLILQTPTETAEDLTRHAFVQAQLQNLETNIQAAEKEIEAEQAELNAATSARAIQQYQSNILALQQKLASYQSTYASLLQTEQGGTNYISVVEPATTPTWPISPQVMSTVLLAAAIGLALALGGAFLIEFLDDTVKTPDDVTRVTKLPTLGAIARIDGKEYDEKLIPLQQPRSPTAEAYRALRTNIQFSSVDRPVRTLLVTSPNPIEGKSITLANLAVVVAQSGRSVILVDADLRRPTQHKIFGLSNHHGLSNTTLESSSSLSEHIQPTQVENLRIITSGPLPPNPADLLGSERMRAIIEELKSQADLVMFDSPPVLAVTDAAVLSTRVDGVLMVNHAGRTRCALARRAVEELRRVDANLLGVVLNQLSLRRGSYYYPQYDYYQAEDRQQKDRRWHRGPQLILGKLKWSGNHRQKPEQHPVVSEPEPDAEQR
jgi:succinoglycan biosynthesis transport protein ExoP